MSDQFIKPMILVVEDDILNQKLITFYLREKYDMCYGASVIESKKCLEANNPDLVLLDLSLLGGENGLELCYYIKHSDKWKHIPVIAVTAHAFSETRQACEDAGSDAYMTKPVKKNELINMIEKYLPSTKKQTT